MSLSRLGWSLFFGGNFLALISTCGVAQTPGIDPRARQFLQRASLYLQQQSSYRFQANITYDDVMSPDLKLQYHAVTQVRVTRPNKLRVDYEGDHRRVSFFYDGTTFTLADRIANVYGTLPSSGSIENTLDQILAKYDFSVPLADFVMDNLYQTLTGKVKKGYYLGLSQVLGRPAHHLAFTQDNINWQIWIQTGKQPLIRKLLIDYKDLPGSPQYAATFSEWDFRPQPAQTFVFTPPPQATSVGFMEIPAGASLNTGPQAQ